MALLDVYDMNNSRTGTIEVDNTVFDVEIKEHLIHEAIRVQLTNRRAGTVSVKNRAAVAGSGKKPFKQKGTGQARQGCRRAPNYPGGGVVFGPQPKTYNLAMNKKAHKSAMKSALSSITKENKLTVLNNLEFQEISTKRFFSLLNRFGFTKTLIVIEGQNTNVELSARNVKNVKVLKAEDLNVYDIINYKNVVFTESSIRKVEGALQI